MAVAHASTPAIQAIALVAGMDASLVVPARPFGDRYRACRLASVGRHQPDARRYADRVPTVFTKIVDGELPARFVWRDTHCVAFLSIAPLRPGHTLVVPREEVDHWIELDPGVMGHLTTVAQTIGRALQAAFSPTKIGLMIAGLEVAHVHLHVVPIDGVHDLDFGNADHNPEPADLDAAADSIRGALRELGSAQVAD